MALILAVGFQARGGISQTLINTGDLLASRLAVIGFGIGEISISGQSMSMEADIAAAIAIDSTSNIFNFDVEAARLRILEIPSINDVSVRKIYPSGLIVEVSEVTPIARWRVDGVTFVIDGRGIQIASATAADKNLPLVIGDGAANDALSMIIALENYPALKDELLALSRIADRRWDMIYSSGLRIQLPETEVGRALFQLQEAQNNSQLLDRDLSVIDMRVATIAALRVNKREEVSH
ncbi:MAG: FtsQ-type POTRA domain-containing protein [Devosiaceae bacterium]|nr:FtsQ-type POTRA domain-containing protein [Devosiaceae bacterium]